MSEEQLVTTFTTLRKKFLHLAARLLPHDEEAEDALQDAFCRLWPRRDHINSASEAEALTTTTIKNICIDKLRKVKHETVPIDEHRDTIEERHYEAEREEFIKDVENIIATALTPVQQQIIEEKEYKGKTIEEIAKALSMQPPAVKMQLSRARKKIREIYKEREL